MTSPTEFTFETSDEGTIYNGPDTVGSIVFGLGTGPDGPSTSFTSPAATSTVSGAGGTFYVMRRNAWRDAWLEQSILTVVANAKKRKRTAVRSAADHTELKARVDRRNKERADARKAAKFDLREANKRHGRNVGCPAGVTLTSLRAMPATVNITHLQYDVDQIDDDGRTQRAEIARVRAEVMAIVNKELASGGMCLDSNGRLMATPTCHANPRVVSVRASQRQSSHSFGCPSKKKAAAASRWSKNKIPGTKKHIGRASNTTAFELPEDATYESCMAACEQTTQVKTKQRRMCVLRCGAEFPTHMLNRPSEAARKRAEAKSKAKRC